MDFLLTLCEDCHAIRQAREDEAKEILGRIFASKSAERLGEFVAEMSKQASYGDFAKLRVLHDMTVFDDAEYRWFEHALEYPEFRPAFEAVTGKRANWEELL